MPTYERPTELTFTFDATIDDNFRRFVLGEWNTKLTNQEKLNPNNIKKVIFNPPATIVIFKDGTKTVVKAHNEEFDPEKGVLMALARHIWDSRADFNRFMEKWVEKDNDKK